MPAATIRRASDKRVRFSYDPATRVQAVSDLLTPDEVSNTYFYWEVVPHNLKTPVLSGEEQVGQTLTVDVGVWGGADTITFSYQWQLDSGSGFANITDATSSSYTIQAGDEGSDLRCVVTGTNGDGSDSANSNSVTVIATEASFSNDFSFDFARVA